MEKSATGLAGLPDSVWRHNQNLLAEGLRNILAEQQKCRELGLFYAWIALDSMVAGRIASMGGMAGEW